MDDSHGNEMAMLMVLLSFIINVAVLFATMILVWKRHDKPWEMFAAGMVTYATVGEIGIQIIHWMNQ